ncbi:24679_t:CDS:2 [Cetraspora pellucida]|uniref:24679_t:CDS:1 n=1 Tax=Cetraspora pellucida TaxID=1433469 RepID=A0A9N9CMJ3_9GLOM|nr:24679_t:CDS:2 [Cetraspora pellucida]
MNVKTGSKITISWILSGTQPKSTFALGIKNVQTLTLNTINADLNLNSKSEDWAVDVETGSYYLYIEDQQLRNLTNSSIFPVVKSDSSDQTQASTIDIGGFKISIVTFTIAVVIVLLICVISIACIACNVCRPNCVCSNIRCCC